MEKLGIITNEAKTSPVLPDKFLTNAVTLLYNLGADAGMAR